MGVSKEAVSKSANMSVWKHWKCPNGAQVMRVWKQIVMKLGSKWWVPSLHSRHRQKSWQNLIHQYPSDGAGELPRDDFGHWHFWRISSLRWRQSKLVLSLVPHFYINPPFFRVSLFFWHFLSTSQKIHPGGIVAQQDYNSANEKWKSNN